MVLPAGEHSPALNDVSNTIDFSGHVDEIIGGYARMYERLIEHRAALMAPGGPIDSFRDDTTRVVLRPTHTYYALYRESAHPDLLRDGLDRDRHFDRLWAGVAHHPELEAVVGHEHADLLWGDIPLFTTRPGSRRIVSSSGDAIDQFLDESGLELVRARLQKMGPADRARQLWLVRSSLAAAMPAMDSTGRPPLCRLLAPSPISGASPLDMARAVGDRLVGMALVDGGHASFLGEVAGANGGSVIRPMGPDLYSGLAGVALFLAWLGALTRDCSYTTSAGKVLQTIRRQVAARAGTAGIGGFSGWGSVVYSLSHIAVLLDDSSVQREAEALAGSLADSIDTDDQFDVLAGSAGLLLALLSLHRVTGSCHVLHCARRCGDHLIAAARRAGPGVGWSVRGLGLPLAGFSHGSAGIALSLLKLSESTRERSYRDVAIAAIAYERTLFDPEAGSWRDLRPDMAAVAPFVNAWCHGAPGIGLGRLRGLASLDDASIRSEIEVAVETTLREGFDTNHSLCHGALGNLELPLAAARAMGRSDWQARVDSAARGLMQRLRSSGPVCGSLQGIETPGFMTGLAGIGYALLRLTDPDRVPSVLAMDPPVARVDAP
jgi:type 2 lantibiotic biosynthesis protein LanM